MEEIAIKQQGELEGLNNKVGAIKTAIAFGITRTSAAQGLYSTGTTGLKNALFKDENNPNGIIPKSARDAENVGKAMQAALEVVNPLFKTLKTNIDDINEVTKISAKIGQSAIDFFKDFDLDKLTGLGTEILNKVMGTSTNVANVGGGGTNSSIVNSSVSNTTNASLSNSNSVNSSLNNSSILNTDNSNALKPQEVTLNEKVDVNVNVTLDPALKDQALKSLMDMALTKYFGPEGGNENISYVLNEMAKQKTQNNLVQSNVT